jgi:nucleotide-binding universal stress UspA family protein
MKRILAPTATCGQQLSVNVTGVLCHGDVVSQIIEYANENKIDLIVMGASQGKVVSQWISADVMGRTAPPVVVVPHQFGPGQSDSERDSRQ